MPNENKNPYYHIGRLHNEGVEYVIHKLNVREPKKFTRLNVLEFTAEYMHFLDCCDSKMIDYKQQNFVLSKIKFVLYFEFLATLQNTIKTKSIMDFAKDANITPEYLALIEMIFLGAVDINESINKPSNNLSNVFQMLDFLEKKTLESSSEENVKRAIGVISAVGRSSIEYGTSIFNEPKRKSTHEFVNSLADENAPLPGANVLFKWPWKADAEGALGGFISGGIGGALGGPAVAAVGGFLGAVGGSISNSIIKSIPAFNKL